MFNKILFTVNKNTKKNLTIAILMAIFITGLTMSSFLVISTDFSYFRFGTRLSGQRGFDYFTFPKSLEFDINNVGKTTIGQGGFPLSYFSDCSIEQWGSVITPVCQSMSLGQDSIAPLLMPFLDILVWAFFSYSLLIFIQALKKKINRKKTALIFILAIAVLAIAVFANGFMGS